MKALRRFGTLGIAMIVAVASLMLGATPASAAGDVHYENVGNPGWCLDGDGIGSNTEAYLHQCGHGQTDFQLWTVGDSGWMFVKHKVSGKCLRVLSTRNVILGRCGEAGTSWYANGKNGWVKFVGLADTTYMCLRPDETWVPGRSAYPLVVDWCDPRYPTPTSLHVAANVDNNVPNEQAWRWHP
ncbi:hypothetical protein DMB66_31965 [Actinoplanes sp. ATCC 53533]|uniref:RICIN domain-containing protein n=1 Tax=Actinoplanes sp. ATCC 53533 TaxID=1288362 RepID=UPI000F795B20|nr:RICIN domain-containing protein [Actinoplanes sp. ATCC 53533]RSM57660.1 hypothetical protein DMB66_31965 [Actinoplanes sp. ATCC 53533]